MSACASFRRVEERTQPVRLFDPQEVATVIDLFVPIRQTHIRAMSSMRRIDWLRVTAAITLTTGLCVATAAAVAARPQPAPALRLGRVTVTRPVIAPAPVAQPAPPAPVAQPAAPEPVVIVPVVIEPRPPSATAVLASLNRTALAAYRRGQLPAALETLSRGIRLCRRPALAWHELCARTHLNAGVVLAEGHQQGGLAAKHFRIARAIQPGIALPAHAGGAIVAAFEESR